MRTVAQRLGEMDPFVRAMARRTAIALATTQATARRLTALGCKTVMVYPEAGLPQGDLAQLSAIGPNQAGTFRMVSIGDLLHLKGFEFGLRAFARFRQACPQSEYWLMGDGPERERLDGVVRNGN